MAGGGKEESPATSGTTTTATKATSVMDRLSAWPSGWTDGPWECFGSTAKQHISSSDSVRTSSSSSSSGGGSGNVKAVDNNNPQQQHSASTPISRFCDKARDMTCAFPVTMLTVNPCASLGRRGGGGATGTLGIAPMTAPGLSIDDVLQNDDDVKNDKIDVDKIIEEEDEPVPRETVRERRIQRYQRRLQQAEQRLQDNHHHEDIEVFPNHNIQIRSPSTNFPLEAPPGAKNVAPVQSLELIELERCISELTMRSRDMYPSNGAGLQQHPENRRMAFYAVGNKNRQNAPGGNRRCYFTGRVILGGTPFYAGCLQQGMRTLVVFCLPSALGLPKKAIDTDIFKRTGSGLFSGFLGMRDQSNNSANVVKQQQQLNDTGRQSSLLRRQNGPAPSVASTSLMSKSRLSSVDDFSSIPEADKDPNWGVDVEYLLRVLPQPNAELLDQIRNVYPDQFETLPSLIRNPSVWKLYTTFCFFSGLPICDGEMHYKVLDNVAEHVWGEPIILSHDVMEAAHGDGSDLLGLPNQHTFQYLKRHYVQQCEKLDDSVFSRNSWVRVAPEV